MTKHSRKLEEGMFPFSYQVNSLIQMRKTLFQNSFSLPFWIFFCFVGSDCFLSLAGHFCSMKLVTVPATGKILVNLPMNLISRAAELVTMHEMVIYSVSA